MAFGRKFPGRVGYSEISGFEPNFISAFHGEKLREDHSIMIRWVDSCAAKASFLAESKEERRLSKEGRNILPREGYERGLYPRRREKGETLVELCGTELCWNLAEVRNLDHWCGLFVQKIQR